MGEGRCLIFHILLHSMFPCDITGSSHIWPLLGIWPPASQVQTSQLGHLGTVFKAFPQCCSAQEHRMWGPVSLGCISTTKWLDPESPSRRWSGSQTADLGRLYGKISGGGGGREEDTSSGRLRASQMSHSWWANSKLSEIPYWEIECHLLLP